MEINCKYLNQNYFIAPCAYQPIDIHNPPAFSFGVRPDLHKANDTPAPNAYGTPVSNEAKGFSFGIKPEPGSTFTTPGK